MNNRMLLIPQKNRHLELVGRKEFISHSGTRTPARAPRQHIPPSIPANDADMKNSTSKNLIPNALIKFIRVFS